MLLTLSDWVVKRDQTLDQEIAVRTMELEEELTTEFDYLNIELNQRNHYRRYGYGLSHFFSKNFSGIIFVSMS